MDAFLPFGDGPRSCIGNRFALAEIKIALIRILAEFKMEMAKDTPVRFHEYSREVHLTDTHPLAHPHRAFFIVFNPNDARSLTHQSVILYYLESPCFKFGLFRLGLRLFFVESWGSTRKKVISHSCIQCEDSHPWVERPSLSSDGSVFVNTHWNTLCWVRRGCKLTVLSCLQLNDKESYFRFSVGIRFCNCCIVAFRFICQFHPSFDFRYPETSCLKHFFLHKARQVTDQ